MKRREFITFVSCAVGHLAVCCVRPAAREGRMDRLPSTSSFESSEARATLNAFRQGLREHGYVEGAEHPHRIPSGGREDRAFPRLTTELTRLNLD
jgi:hypothetical protein